MERSQHITQNDPRVYGRDYVANTSSCDGISAFHNEPAKHDHVEYFQSFALLREKGLPSRLPAEQKAAIQNLPLIKSLQDNLLQLSTKSASKSEIQSARTRFYTVRSKLEKDALADYQLQWVQQRRDWKVMTRGKQRKDDDESKDLVNILRRLMPERDRLARLMTMDTIATEVERRQAVEDLYLMASQDCEVIYLPGDKPINGSCPLDGCEMKLAR